jgi:hypothetical protein
LLRIVLATILLTGASLPAGAQSAEETVLFLLFGLEAGTTQSPHITVNPLSPSRWSVTIEFGPNTKFYSETEIIANSVCSYSINTFDRNGTRVKGAVFDFSHVSHYDVDTYTPAGPFGPGWITTQTIIISGPDLYIESVSDPQTGEVQETQRDIWRGPVFAASDRLRGAYSYFSRKFCAGRAF